MNILTAFPTKYVAESDLQGQQVPCTIDRVVMENLGEESDEYKPIVYFRGMKKGLVLNKTNATAIADAFGPETDQWIGQTVTLFPAVTDFKGRATPCIRVKAVRAAIATQPAATQPAQPAAATQPGPIAF